MITKIIEKVYGKGAKYYDEIMAKYWPAPRAELIESLNLKKGDKVLEAVVGTGLDLPYFPAGVYVTGIDITKEMLNEAREKKKFLANVKLRKMDIRTMDFPDDYFDSCVSTFTLCVIKNPTKALSEIIRVTKKGAKIAILDYCKSKNPEVEKWQELIQYHAAYIGFPRDVIVWNSLMDYDKLVYGSGLPIKVDSDERIESENPFLTACNIILRNEK